MARNSKIQWTESTWNPWMGCSKVSPGCKYCYMFRDMERYGMEPATVARSKTRFVAPLNWKEPRLIFTCSWSDFFIPAADEWRPEAWAVIKATPQHTYQILTKRPERLAECLPPDWGDGYPNVWLGVSVERQDLMPRVHWLAGVPAAVRWISFEPLLGPINLYSESIEAIDWAVIGGESGNESGPYKYRRCDIAWIESLAQQLAFRGIPTFIKQMGTYIAKKAGMKDRHGGDINQFPDHLKIRDFPKAYEPQAH